MRKWSTKRCRCLLASPLQGLTSSREILVAMPQVYMLDPLWGQLNNTLPNKLILN